MKNPNQIKMISVLIIFALSDGKIRSTEYLISNLLLF